MASSKGNQTGSDEIYAKHKKVYAREVKGTFASLRMIAMLALLGFYYLAPWLQWDNRQALLFDLPARKFYILGWVFWPQDFFYLALLLMIAAFALFFFTTLAGRLWCGYACPQTVWTEIFMWIEHKIEGDRSQQMKLDAAPMSARKIRIKATKHFIWAILGLWTGFTFVGYFTPIDHLWHSALHFSLSGWETFWIFFYGFATWGNAGWMREQVCIYMCPYARFQSAMFDHDTLIISYDEQRGEPRGSRKKGVDFKDEGLGSCIDCTLCVQVCPVGIDIRNGLQYQCIGCAACVDVCDQVMDKMAYPRGLVRYTTDSTLAGKKTHILRPRIVIYALLLVVLSTGVLYGIATRTPLELDIIRDRNTLYRETNQGLTENVYTLKIVNMDEAPHNYQLGAYGLEGLTLDADENPVKVGPGTVYTTTVRVRVDPVVLKKASNEIFFTLEAEDNPDLKVVDKARFMGPVL
jgi:cytochrome c oxidase accessory protein FixG